MQAVGGDVGEWSNAGVGGWRCKCLGQGCGGTGLSKGALCVIPLMQELDVVACTALRRQDAQ